MASDLRGKLRFTVLVIISVLYGNKGESKFDKTISYSARQNGGRMTNICEILVMFLGFTSVPRAMLLYSA